MTKQQFFTVQRNLLPSWLSYWPIALVILGLTAFNISVGVGWERFFRDPFSAIGDLASMAVLIVLLPLFIRRAWARAYRQSQELHGDISGEVESSAITWKTKLSTSTLIWENVVKAKVLPNLVLLFYTKRCAFYFPRHFFKSEDDWAQFLEMVASRTRG